MQQLADYITQITGSDMLVRIVVALIVLVAIAIVCHIAVKAAQRVLSLEDTSLSQTSIVVNIVRIVVWGLGLCLIADVVFDINMSAVIAALGVGGIAISLGFQNVLSNLFGGIQITLTHVVKPGDNIRVSTNQGVVQDINWSFTTIHNLNNETVMIPNSVMASNAVTQLPPVNQVSVPIVVMNRLDDLDALTAKVQETALEAAKEISAVTKDPTVTFNKATEEGLRGSITLTIKDGSKASAVSDAITRAVAPLIQNDFFSANAGNTAS